MRHDPQYAPVRAVRSRAGTFNNASARAAVAALVIGACAICSGCHTAQGIVDDVGVGVQWAEAALDVWAGKPVEVY